MNTLFIDNDLNFLKYLKEEIADSKFENYPNLNLYFHYFEFIEDALRLLNGHKDSGMDVIFLDIRNDEKEVVKKAIKIFPNVRIYSTSSTKVALHKYNNIGIEVEYVGDRTNDIIDAIEKLINTS